jgi:acetyl-CoA carboxylase biotin carboxyl carrier protein
VEQSESGAPSPERVAELVRSLASVMRQSEVTELDLDLGELSLRLRRPTRQLAEENDLTSEPGNRSPHADALDHVITAPMIGTFYASPTPGAAAFVTAGDHVAAGQTIGIIEAMKIMNEISADRAGVVEAVYVSNGQPVEYGSPLMSLSLPASARP